MVDKLNLFTFSKLREEAFVSDGFRNWAMATIRFKLHENLHAPKEATLKFSSYISNHSVLLTIKRKALQETVKCREALLKIVGSLAFLARQLLERPYR